MGEKLTERTYKILMCRRLDNSILPDGTTSGQEEHIRSSVVVEVVAVGTAQALRRAEAGLPGWTARLV